MQQKHQGPGLERDVVARTSKIANQSILPLVEITETVPVLPGIGGGLAYDLSTRKPYYCDGFAWFPLASGGSGIIVQSFGFQKQVDQSIPSATDTVVSGWTTAGSPAYSTIPNWNL